MLEELRQAGPDMASGMKMSSVLIVDDEPGIRSFLQRGLQKHFGLVETAEDAETAEILHQRCYFDLIIADIRLPGRSSVEWVTELREQGNHTGVIFITAHADLETAIAALRAGAEDFIMKPFRMEQMITAVERYLENKKIQRENFILRRQVDHIFEQFVGDSEVIKGVYEVIKRVAPTPSTVLIEGESGTGKELAARAIHEGSGRSGSFVPVNCGGMSPELMESELFGHVKGAFTGAHQARDGLFSYANGGTLFLDEIGEMPLAMQAHLLRVLEERMIRPVGSNREMAVDVRIIAATNRNLKDLVKQGQFREDLYYRLNVITVNMPSLQDRREDIPALARHFFTSLAAELGLEAPPLDQGNMDLLSQYNWQGNVRELKNLVERCLLLNKLPSECPIFVVNQEVSETEPEPQSLALEEVEKQHILKVLEQHGGNKSAAARVLGVSRKTLERKVQAWEMQQA